MDLGEPIENKSELRLLVVKLKKGDFMKIQDTIQHWGSFTWGGSYSGMDSFSLDLATSFIKGVEDVEDRFGQKSIRITVQKVDNNVATVTVPFNQVIPSQQAVFDKVVRGLKSSIGKTLNEAGEIII